MLQFACKGLASLGVIVSLRRVARIAPTCSLSIQTDGGHPREKGREEHAESKLRRACEPNGLQIEGGWVGRGWST